MLEYLNHLFGTDGFQPRFQCMMCNEKLAGFYALNNGLIALAYILIPASLIVLMRKVRWSLVAPFKYLIGMFAAFIFSCSIGHIINVVMLWYPMYRFSVFWDGVTAFISLATVAFILPIAAKTLKKLQ